MDLRKGCSATAESMVVKRFFGIRRIRWWLLIIAAATPGLNYAATPLGCGDVFQNARGPFDYRDAAAAGELRTVETNHFDSGVEALKGHANRAGLRGVAEDLHFTLRYFPNHHRALHTVVRYHTQLDPLSRPQMALPAECYFQRAVTFRPEDAVVRLIYGLYLVKMDDVKRGLEQLAEAARLNPGSAEVHYNLGLVYFRLGDMERSRKHAKTAYEGGYPLPGLKRMLADKGIRIDT